MNNFKESIGKILLIFIVLALLECLLWGIGYVYTFYHRYEIEKRLSALKNQDIRIICLGDSHTFGSESAYGDSYPEQLERLLNEKIINSKFVVYNLGIIGQNSFQVKNNLERNFLSYNPDYIIVLIGVNNRWNLSGRSCEFADDLQIRPKSGILNLFNSLRLVKLVRLVVANIKYKLFLCSIFSVQRVNFVTREDNKKIKITLNEELQQNISLIQQDIEKNNISEAFKMAEQILEKYPGNGSIHALLGQIYYLQGSYEKSIEEYDKALALEPNNILFLHGKALSYRESGDIKKALNIYGVIAKREPQNKLLKMDFRHTFLNFKGKWALSEQEQKIMDYWLRQDLTEIAKISLGYKKKLIFLTYPTQNWQDEIRKEVSGVFNLPLVDIYSAFKRLTNVLDYLGRSGGHPNDKGYYIMAQEVFNLIKRDFNPL